MARRKGFRDSTKARISKGALVTTSEIVNKPSELVDGAGALTRDDLVIALRQRHAAVRLAQQEVALAKAQIELDRENDAARLAQFQKEARDRRLIRAAERGQWMDADKSITEADRVEGEMFCLLINPPAMVEPYDFDTILAAVARAKEAGEMDQRLPKNDG